MTRFAASPSVIGFMDDPYGAQFDQVAGHSAMNRGKLDNAAMMGDYLAKAADIQAGVIEAKGDMQADLTNAQSQSQQMQGWGSLLGQAGGAFGKVISANKIPSIGVGQGTGGGFASSVGNWGGHMSSPFG